MLCGEAACDVSAAEKAEAVSVYRDGWNSTFCIF